MNNTPELDKLTRLVEHPNGDFTAVGMWNGDAILMKIDADISTSCLGDQIDNPSNYEDIDVSKIVEDAVVESLWEYVWTSLTLYGQDVQTSGNDRIRRK